MNAAAVSIARAVANAATPWDIQAIAKERPDDFQAAYDAGFLSYRNGGPTGDDIRLTPDGLAAIQVAS